MNQDTTAPKALTIIGPGRVGSSIARAAAAAGVDVELVGRDSCDLELGSTTVLICVPDGAIAEVAEAIAASGPLPDFTGHTSGATTLEPLASAQAKGAFSLHPLQTVPDAHTDLNGCPCAVAGSNPATIALAGGLGKVLGMKPFEVAEDDRALYHAAAAIASNFLVTLEETAAGIFDDIGIENSREVLYPLVQRSLDNWRERGADALTGPIARGDEVTVGNHENALGDSHPELLGFYELMGARTRELVASR